jgi:hypothetical protein
MNEEEDERMKIGKWIILGIECVLAIVGLVFLALSIFRDVPGNRYLPIGLGCISCVSLINLVLLNIRNRKNKQ